MADDIELAPSVPKSSTWKTALIVVVGMLVAVGGTIGGLFAMGVLPGGADPTVAQVQDTPVEEVKKEALYISLDPAFTVNFSDKGSVRYLQLSLEAMTRDAAVEPEIKRHMPVIRNDLMLLFSAKTSAELVSREGKEALQAEALASIQGILEREIGGPGVEAVYFTSFVMQ
jgi:flagellar FliL protein